MYTQLSALEAFTAKQQSKNVVCRFESHDEYVQLNEVSAESFFNPAYIFAIKLETITVGEYEFTKPYSLDELIEGQEIYFVGASGIILKGTFCPGNKMLVDGVTAGSVQRDAENAITQMKALRSVLGLQCNDPEIIKYNFADQPKEEPEQKKTRRGRKKTDEDKSQKLIDLWISRSKDDPTLYNLEQIQSSIEHNFDKLTEDHKIEANNILAQFKEKVNVALTALDEQNDLVNDSANSQVEVNAPATIIEDYRFQINNAPTVDDVLKIRSLFAANNHLEREQVQSLCVLCEAKIEELNWWESQKQVEADTNTGANLVEFKKLKEDAEQSIYQEQLKDLVERASKAMTPKEVNALVRYTTTWTQEQRAPLIRAISKRLTELPQPKQDEVKIPLISQLQDAPDLKTLELYETEISLAHPSVHKTLQNMATKRRGELTRSGAE
ncbi:hypothetical protein [uncultured Acinetobacter sp.]|uniref:hypothetical protein n=1 Tax=uncultured Acinetobacter sp. TaxID=165433 RepID=UPI0037499870